MVKGGVCLSFIRAAKPHHESSYSLRWTLMIYHRGLPIIDPHLLFTMMVILLFLNRLKMSQLLCVIVIFWHLIVTFQTYNDLICLETSPCTYIWLQKRTISEAPYTRRLIKTFCEAFEVPSYLLSSKRILEKTLSISIIIKLVISITDVKLPRTISLDFYQRFLLWVCWKHKSPCTFYTAVLQKWCRFGIEIIELQNLLFCWDSKFIANEDSGSFEVLWSEQQIINLYWGNIIWNK